MTLGKLGSTAARLGRTLRSHGPARSRRRDQRRDERRRARGAAELSVVLVAGALTAGVMFGQGLSRTSVSNLVAELREVLPTATVWLALVLSRLDAGATVAELRGFPRARLIYGVLAERVFEEMLKQTG